MSNALRFLQKRAKHQDCPFFNDFKPQKLHPKYLENALTDFAQTSRTSRRLLEKEVPVNDFGITIPSAERNIAANKIGNGVILLL